jgi:hypothetical protein
VTQQFPQGMLETAFQLNSVVPVADANRQSGDCYRYVISQGTNMENAITGIRYGSLADVHHQLREMVERLNERFGKTKKK